MLRTFATLEARSRSSQDPSGFGAFAAARIIAYLDRRLRRCGLDEQPDLVFACPLGAAPGQFAWRCRLLLLWLAEWTCSTEWQWCEVAGEVAERRLAIGPMLPPLYGPHDAVSGGRFRHDPEMVLLPVWYGIDPAKFWPDARPRRYVWAPGVVDRDRDYYLRRSELQAAIAQSGLPTFASGRSVPLAAGATLCGGDAAHGPFNSALNECRLVCCDGSKFAAPVAKFCEIAATASPMLAVVPGGFAALGFQAGEHYVADRGGSAVDTASHLRALYSDPDLPRVGEAAAALVRTRHTQQARGRQIDAILDSVVAVEDAHVIWHDGACLVNGEAVA